MKLKALICHRYRAFKERHRIELSPVTVIIGKNGSGKSIISRLPLLMAASISDSAEGPLDMSAGGIEHAASFQDLIHSRSSLPFALGAEIADEETTYVFETTIRYVLQTRSLVIEEFILQKNKVPLISLVIEDAAQLENNKPKYVITLSGDSTITGSSEVSFSGLFPLSNGLNSITGKILDDALTLFRQALPAPSYLGPFRSEPERSMRMPNQSIRNLGPRGERALEMLADDQLRHDGKLATMVQQWFGESMGQEISVDVTGEQLKAIVIDRAKNIQVSLFDTGAGFSQAIPVVVQNFAYRVGRIKSPLLIIEQPELHLHPAAHGALADLILQTSTPTSNWTPATYIIETHSEQFIMRLRRRIAEGLNPDFVRLISLEHTESSEPDATKEPLRAIRFDKTGDPDAWPTGVFEEAFDDLMRMRKASREANNAN